MSRCHLSKSVMWLGHLREGAFSYDEYIQCIREEARNGNFSLAAIGTSEKELEELRVKGCKTAALIWLGYLRKGSKNYDSYTQYILKDVAKGGFSLKEIGTSKEELDSFRSPKVPA